MQYFIFYLLKSSSQQESFVCDSGSVVHLFLPVYYTGSVVHLFLHAAKQKHRSAQHSGICRTGSTVRTQM